VNGCKSSSGCVRFGVPPGSLLGPRLYTIFVNDLPDCLDGTGEIYLYADDTTLSYIGRSVEEIFTALNKMVNDVLLWNRINQLIIHQVKTEAMLIRKSPFVGPLPPLYFGSHFIQIVESSTCLGFNLDNKVGALKRMKYLPGKTLAEIYFKTIIPSVTYGIMSWGNCSTTLLSYSDTIHSRAAKIIYSLDSSLSDAACLLTCSWPSISYFYKKCVLSFMHKIYFRLGTFFQRMPLADLCVPLNRWLYPDPILKWAGTPYGIEGLLSGTLPTKLLKFQRA